MLGQTGDTLCLWSWNDPFRRRTMPRLTIQSRRPAKRFTRSCHWIGWECIGVQGCTSRRLQASL